MNLEQEDLFLERPAEHQKRDWPLDARWLGGPTMIQSSDLSLTRMPLNNGGSFIPALGFGTLIPDLSASTVVSASRL